MNVVGPGRRIVGAAGGKDVTLDGCVIRNTSFSSPGILRQEYYVPMVFTGVQFDADEALDFDKVTVSFDHLPFWINRNNFNFSLDTSSPNDLTTVTKYTVTSEVPPKESARTDQTEVELGYNSSVGGDRFTEMHVTQRPSLSLAYTERRALLDILADVNGLQDLVTLGMGAPAVLTDVVLRRSDLARQIPDGRTVQIPIQAYWSNIAERVRVAKPSDKDMLFSFGQADGLRTIAKWVQLSRDYRLVLGLLLSEQYAPQMYGENAFANAISAAETLHRMRFENEIEPTAIFKSRKRKMADAVKKALGPKAKDWLHQQLAYSNEPRLRKRLADLANYAGPNLSGLVGDVDTWAGVVTLVRNRMTHHDPNQRIERQPGDLTFLGNSIYIVTALALLRECDVPDVVYQAVLQSARAAFTRGKLSEVVPRFEQFLRR
jgi:ApeA N-terminal domain 1/Apea-like HEPN